MSNPKAETSTRRVCSTCKLSKNRSSYYACHHNVYGRGDGLSYSCRSCDNKARLKRYYKVASCDNKARLKRYYKVAA